MRGAVLGAACLTLGGCTLLFEPNPGRHDGGPPDESDAAGMPVDAAASVDAAPLQPPSLIDSFNGSIGPEWSTTFQSGNCAVVDDPVRAGSHSLRCETLEQSGTRAALVYDFTPSTELYVQMYVRFGSVPGNSQTDWVTFIETGNVDDEDSLTLLLSADYYGNQTLDVYNFTNNAYDQTADTFGTGTWYLVDFAARVGTQSDAVALWVEKVQVARLSGDDASVDVPHSRLMIGIPLIRPINDPNVLFIDEVVVSSEPIDTSLAPLP